MRRLFAYFLASGALISTASADSGVNILISNSAAAAGSTTQIQFFLAKPQTIAEGELNVDLDPAVFGAVTAVSAFSATGDAMGYAAINGRHVDVAFRSPSGGIGKIAGNPIITVTVAILPGAVPGTRATVTADPSGSPWLDPARNKYSVSVTAGTVTIGGALSVRSVQPGSGILPTGAVIRIDGTGFSAVTTVDIQAAAVASATVVSSTQINVTLAAPTEISGKRVRVRNPDGAQVDFFPAWMGDVLSTTSDDPYFNTFPILPLQAYRQAFTGSFRVFSGWLVLQNPNSDPVDVALQVLQGNYLPSGQVIVRIPPGGSSYQNLGTLGVPLENSVRILASAPVRAVELSAYTNYFSLPPYVSQRSISGLSPIDLGPLRVEADRNEDSLSWVWRTGPAKPAAKTFHVRAANRDQSANFTVSVATASGDKWLSATPSTGITCANPGSSCSDPLIAASVDPTGLAPGIYRGSITLTPAATTVRPDVSPTVLAVSLTVTAAPIVNNVVEFSTTFVKPGPPNYSASQPYNVSTEVFPAGFSIAVHTDSGGNWLSATASSATAPAVLTVFGDLGSLAPGRYSGEVILTGGGNTMVIPALAFIYSGLQLSADYPLPILRTRWRPTPPAQIATVTPQCLYCPDPSVPASIPFAAFVKTDSGGNWLSALPSAGSVSASVNSVGLAPGVYTGAITLSASAATGPTRIPVVLTVWTGSAPGLSSSPSSLFSIWQDYAGGGYFCLSAGTMAVTLDARGLTSDGGDWLKVRLTAPVTFTCGISVELDGSKLAPGTYTGSVVVTATDQSISIPVTFFVPAAPVPLIGSILNAASAIEGAVAGRDATIHGVGIGPLTPVSGKVASSLNGAQVLLDGTPALLIYASATQVNAIMPYELAGRNSVTVQARFNGVSSSWTVPLASASPAIFTLDSSGSGGAAVLNQDDSINGPANPAARGGVIQIFATGVNFPNAGGPVSVSIGGADAAIQYAGPAPGAVAGLFQVNAVVPAAAIPGPTVPILFAIGPLQSQGGTTIAVQ